MSDDAQHDETAAPSAADGSMTASLATRVLGAVALLATVVMLVLGLVISPKDVVQGDAVRLLYVHVPVIWIAYGSFLLTSVASALYLWRAPRRADDGRAREQPRGPPSRLVSCRGDCGTRRTIHPKAPRPASMRSRGAIYRARTRSYVGLATRPMRPAR